MLVFSQDSLGKTSQQIILTFYFCAIPTLTKFALLALRLLRRILLASGKFLILFWRWLGTISHPLLLPFLSGQSHLEQGFKIFVLALVIIGVSFYLIQAENKLLIEPTKADTIGRSTILATLFVDTLQEDYVVESPDAQLGENDPNDKLAVRPSALQAKNADDSISWINQNEEDSTLLARPNILNTKSNQLTKVTKYVVQFGDTPGSIAERFRLKLQTILDNNNLSSKNFIKVGQTLWLPQTDGLIVTWTKNSTLKNFAQKYKISTESILQANNLGPNDKIALAEKIVLPGARPISAPPIKNIARAKTTTSGASRARTGGANALKWPTSVNRITTYFSLRHPGIDIAGPMSSPIYAAEDGTIATSRNGWNGGYGNYIIINHGNGKETLYGHLSRRLVQVGEEVERGQVIGYMGSSGRSTGPHVHFEVRIFKRQTNPFSSL